MIVHTDDEPRFFLADQATGETYPLTGNDADAIIRKSHEMTGEPLPDPELTTDDMDGWL